MRTPFEAIDHVQPTRSGFWVTLSVLALAGNGLLRGAEYQTDVLPIFTNRCKDCHMEGKSKGHLALDADKISKEIGSSKAIVPGEPEKSDLLRVLKLKEGDEERMPPKGPPLSEEEIGKIRTWISEGAKLPEADPKGTEKKEENKEKPEAKTEGAAAPETWTSTSGTSVTATLLKVDPARKTIVLKREDGSTMEVPIAKLDEDSKARAKAFWEKNK